ncbi:MAG: hypothetical protein P8Y02_10570 [Deinococcales bacterium]
MTERTSSIRASLRWFAIAIVALALLGAVAEFAIEAPHWADSTRVMWRGSSRPGHIGAHFRYFQGNDGRPISGTAGKTLTIRYDLEPEQGALELHLLSPEGDAIWTRSAAEPELGSSTIPLPESGRYWVQVTGKKTRGGFEVNYQLDTAGPH